MTDFVNELPAKPKEPVDRVNRSIDLDGFDSGFFANFPQRRGSGLLVILEVALRKAPVAIAIANEQEQRLSVVHAIDHASGEHVISGHDNLVSNGQGGTQGTATGLEAVELVPQIALPLVRAAETAAPTRIVRRWTLPLRARPLFCLPALS